MSLTEEEVNQLFTVAVLAFRAVESIGAGVENNKLPGKMPELDSFLANGVDDRLWNKINEVADSSKKPPFFLTKRAPDAANTWCKDNDTITDDFGSTISAWCPNGCGKTMQVVRPGKFQCSECY